MAAAKITLAVLQKNGLSVEEYWSKRHLEMIKLEKKNFVFSELGKNENVPMKEGTTNYTVYRYNHLPVTNHKLTEGVAPASMKPEGHKVTGTIHQFGVVMEETDVAADVHFDNIKTIYQPELARHAAEVRERNIIDNLIDISIYYVGTGVTSIDTVKATDILKFKDLRIVKLSMENHNRVGHRKYGNKFINVVHPNVMNDLLDDDVLTQKLLVPGNENTPIKEGSLMRYKAYDMYYTDSLICPTESNTGGVTVYSSFCLGRDPYMVMGLGSNNVKFYDTGFTPDKSDPLGQKATFGYKMWTGAKVIDPMAITRIYSASGYDVTADFTNDDIGKPASQA